MENLLAELERTRQVVESLNPENPCHLIYFKFVEGMVETLEHNPVLLENSLRVALGILEQNDEDISDWYRIRNLIDPDEQNFWVPERFNYGMKILSVISNSHLFVFLNGG